MKFCTELDNDSVTLNIKRDFQKSNGIIDNDIIQNDVIMLKLLSLCRKIPNNMKNT